MDIQDLIKKADSGDAEAQAELAICYEEGDGVKINNDKAFHYYTLAAEQKNAKGINCLGLCYENGIGVEIDTAKAVEYYKEAADMGYPAAQNNLGLAYENGDGVEQNNELAMKYYKLSADQGYTNGQFNLAMAYYFGNITEENNELAFKYFKLAADQEFSDAYYYLGMCYFNGWGTKRNVKLAFKYFLAGSEDDENCKLALANCYFHGTGTEENNKKAKDLFYSLLLVTEDDDIKGEACYLYGLCLECGYGCRKDKYLAFLYYKDAAKKKYPYSYCRIGDYYAEEICDSITPNPKTAFNWYKKAAQVENDEGCYKLGCCYRDGLGVKTNYATAAGWFKKALDLGYSCKQEYNDCLKESDGEINEAPSTTSTSSSSDEEESKPSSKKLTSNLSKQEKDPEEELNELIGLSSVKKQINRIKSFLIMNKNKKLSLHMAFTGNPGTGKTVVARLVGRIFQKYGVLPKSDNPLVEADRSHLVGEYIGHTEKKVGEILKKSMGKVLFIDEAYALAGGGKDDSSDFGKEAINLLIKSMEDHRGEFSVILAGYTKEMEEMIALNPGFKSRIQFIIEFPNYNHDELREISKFILKKEFPDYTMNDEPLEKMLEVVESTRNHKDFANARSVRNAIQKLVMIQNERVVELKQYTNRTFINEDVDNLAAEYKIDLNKKEKENN